MSVSAHLAEHGATLLVGVSVVLVAGCLAVLPSRAPVHRQRLGEATLLCAICWLVAAVVPLPRLDLGAAAREAFLPRPVHSAMERGAGSGGPTARLARGSSGERLPGAGVALALPASRDVAGTEVSSTVRPARLELPARVPGDAVVDARLEAPLPGSVAHSIARPIAQPVDWARLAAGVYLAGAIGSAALLLLSILCLRRLLRTAQPVPPSVARLFAQLPRTNRRVRLLQSDRARRPFCTSFGPPTIVLPAVICRPERRAPLRGVLLHELAHLERRDGRGQLLFTLALPLLFVHPLYWWLRRHVRLAAELVADDVAAAHGRRREYAEELIDLAERLGTATLPAVGIQPAFHSRSEFHRRIEMLINRRDRLATRQTGARRVAQACAFTVLLGFTSAAWGIEPAAAQGRDSRHALQQESDALRQQIRSLQAELEDLRRELERLRAPRTAPSTTPEAAPLPTGTGLPGRLPAASEGAGSRYRRLPGSTGSAGFTEPRPRANPGPGGTLPAPVPVATWRSLPGGTGIGETLPSASPPESAPEPENPLVTVRRGDSLPSIARRFNPELESIDPILRLNPGLDPERLPVGTTLRLPAARAPQPAPPTAADSLPEPRVDIVDLVTRTIELEGQAELAAHELARTKDLVARAAASSTDLRRAEIEYATQRRSLAVLRLLVGAEVEATEAELRSLEGRLAQSGNESARSALRIQVVRARARLEVLEQVR